MLLGNGMDGDTVHVPLKCLVPMVEPDDIIIDGKMTTNSFFTVELFIGLIFDISVMANSSVAENSTCVKIAAMAEYLSTDFTSIFACKIHITVTII